MFLRVSRAESDACPPGRISCSPTGGADMPNSNSGPTNFSEGRSAMHRYIGVVMVAVLVLVIILGYIYFAHWRWRERKWWCCGPRRPPELLKKKRPESAYSADDEMDSVKGGRAGSISLSRSTTAHDEKEVSERGRGRGRTKGRSNRGHQPEPDIPEPRQEPLIDLKALDDQRRRERRERDREGRRMDRERNDMSEGHDQDEDTVILDDDHNLTDDLDGEVEEWDYREEQRRRRKRRPKQKIMPDKPEVVKQVSGGLVYFAEVPKPIVPPRRDRYPQGEWEMGHLRGVRFEARTPPAFHGRTSSHDRS